VNRGERQGAILRLVREQPVSTQAELAEALRAAGHEVVQTTVSRDIRELGLVKVRDAAGRLVYAPLETARPPALAASLRRAALSIEASGNLVLVVTPSGFASALAEELDRAAHPLVLGTVAGDNTIIVVAREGVPGTELRDDLRAYLTEGAA
jgi:transcriptional regulator of arginine metabolism